MVPILHRETGHTAEKVRGAIDKKTNPNVQHGDKLYRISPHEVLQGGGEGMLKSEKEEARNNFLLLRRSGLMEDLQYLLICSVTLTKQSWYFSENQARQML